EAEIDRFVEAERVHCAAQETLLHLAGLIFARGARRRQFRTDPVVTGVTRDFFDQIFFLFDVDAPRRDFEIQLFGRVVEEFEAEALENTDYFLLRDGDRSQFEDTLWAKSDRARGKRAGINIDRIFGSDPARKLTDQLHTTLLSVEYAF